MTTDIDCAHTQERLEAAFWSRASPPEADAVHAADCAACGELIGALETLADSLETARPPALAADRARSILQLAARELTGSMRATKPMVRPELPSGYARELIRILFWALLPLPLVLFAYVQLFQLGGALLGGILPDWGLVAVGIAAASGAASWLAVVYGSIPLVVYRQLSRVDPSFRPTQTTG